jgi:hypothetical protein
VNGSSACGTSCGNLASCLKACSGVSCSSNLSSCLNAYCASCGK